MEIGNVIDKNKSHLELANVLTDEAKKNIRYSLDGDIYVRFFNDLYDVEDLTYIVGAYIKLN